MKKLYIIKAGSTFENIINDHGDFEDWIIKYIDDDYIQIIDIQNNEELPFLSSCLGVIVTGSHSMVTQELPWSLKLESFIRELVFVKIPFLGICYGHQLLAKSLGGIVDYHPNGMEVGTVNISLSQNAYNDAIFKHLPSSFEAHVVHSQSAITLPTSATLLAYNSYENNHAFKIGSNAWGVQFHPKYDENIMKLYINEVLKEDEEKRKIVLANVKECKYSNEIIRLFMDIVKVESMKESA
jgi:GMP synthase (glutamine-hydrolysing)